MKIRLVTAELFLVNRQADMTKLSLFVLLRTRLKTQDMNLNEPTMNIQL